MLVIDAMGVDASSLEVLHDPRKGLAFKGNLWGGKEIRLNDVKSYTYELQAVGSDSSSFKLSQTSTARDPFPKSDFPTERSTDHRQSNFALVIFRYPLSPHSFHTLSIYINPTQTDQRKNEHPSSPQIHTSILHPHRPTSSTLTLFPDTMAANTK
ncbi:hypothetical protein BDQ17DRAFT_1430179 [Cyathus striatus]|nr:hypothetical protein BDQ17DRAFT_1430179 [Cyathus striatus]